MMNFGMGLNFGYQPDLFGMWNTPMFGTNTLFNNFQMPTFNMPSFNMPSLNMPLFNFSGNQTSSSSQGNISSEGAEEVSALNKLHPGYVIAYIDGKYYATRDGQSVGSSSTFDGMHEVLAKADKKYPLPEDTEENEKTDTYTDTDTNTDIGTDNYSSENETLHEKAYNPDVATEGDEDQYRTTDAAGIYYKDGVHYKKNSKGKYVKVPTTFEGTVITQYFSDGSHYEKSNDGLYSYYVKPDGSYQATQYDKNNKNNIAFIDYRTNDNKRTRLDVYEKGKLSYTDKYDNNGVHTTRERRNGSGQIIRFAQFYPDGKTVKWQTTYSHDKDDNKTTAYYGTDAKPTKAVHRNKYGWQKTETYDHGVLVKMNYKENGKIVTKNYK